MGTVELNGYERVGITGIVVKRVRLSDRTECIFVFNSLARIRLYRPGRNRCQRLVRGWSCGIRWVSPLVSLVVHSSRGAAARPGSYQTQQGRSHFGCPHGLKPIERRFEQVARRLVILKALIH